MRCVLLTKESPRNAATWSQLNQFRDQVRGPIHDVNTKGAHCHSQRLQNRLGGKRDPEKNPPMKRSRYKSCQRLAGRDLPGIGTDEMHKRATNRRRMSAGSVSGGPRPPSRPKLRLPAKTPTSVRILPKVSSVASTSALMEPALSMETRLLCSDWCRWTWAMSGERVHPAVVQLGSPKRRR